MGCKDDYSSWSIGSLEGTRRKLWCPWTIFKFNDGSNEESQRKEDKKGLG